MWARRSNFPPIIDGRHSGRAGVIQKLVHSYLSLPHDAAGRAIIVVPPIREYNIDWGLRTLFPKPKSSEVERFPYCSNYPQRVEVLELENIANSASQIPDSVIKFDQIFH